MRILIVRHWETLENIAGIVQGQIDWVLSENGISQSKSLWSMLSSVKIDYVFSSDLWRASQTAEIIIKNHPSKIIINYDIRLRERNNWKFEGKRKDDIFVEYGDQSLHNILSNNWAESLESMFARGKEFIDDILFRYWDDDTILILGHWWINSSIMTYLEWWQYNDWYKTSKNCELIAYEKINNSIRRIGELF